MRDRMGMGLFATVVALMVGLMVVVVRVAAVQVVVGRGTVAWAAVVRVEAVPGAVVTAVVARVGVARAVAETVAETEAAARELVARVELMVEV